MRVVALVLCAILVSSAASKFSGETVCPENYRLMVEELKKAIDSPKTVLEDKRAAFKMIFSLLANCAKEFIKNKITPPTKSLAVSSLQCTEWKIEMEVLQKLILNPKTRTDKIVWEYHEIGNMFMRNCL